MSETSDLTNHFLIAMPGLADPNFSHTVTYICEHNEKGAMGIVINRPSELTLGEVFDHMGIEASPRVDVEVPVYEGGPVEPEHGFVIHASVGAWDSSLKVTDDIAVTTSRDVLSAIAYGEGPKRYLFALGYAGWGAGQLEDEIASNAWLSGPADSSILFESGPGQRWTAAAALLGVDVNLLSSQIGHA
ncbi:YqgE/AlgH family protein [Thiohalomonas denitrificans]|uniref:YqgE/AlgH family protein n=1 Tax=Thiohalomonas denitrificans TaxID=415747 RepID=UPI0026EE64C4|nr:YqgE/AlgH family protein [Thiohalomonas denitrificans]